MHVLHEAKQDAWKILKQAFGKGYTPSIDEIEQPPDPKMGDLAFPCFSLAKGLKRNPVEIADEIAAKIAPKGLIGKIESKGPYVNFFFDQKTFGKKLFDDIFEKGDSYGGSDIGEEKRIMVEYASLNTHKDPHIGHLRTIFLGQLLVHLFKKVGYEVIAATYIGDLGTHVSRCLWGLKKFYANIEPPKKDQNKFLGEVYVRAVQALEHEPLAKEEIDAISRDIEAKRGDNFFWWKKTREWSLREIKTIFKELNLPIDAWYFESGVTSISKKTIAHLLKKGIAKKSDGAIIIDLYEEGLGVNLLVKSDGTLLYNARDLGLAFKKQGDYHPDRSLYVVDSRQNLALQQLFVTLKRMGFEEKLEHISYEFITLKDGAMSARKGNVIRYQDFRDQMEQIAREQTLGRHPDWKTKKIEETAKVIASSAMRFSILHQDPGRKITFDMKEALSFEGCTGPYLLYTIARISSILRKASSLEKKKKNVIFSSAVEHELLVFLSFYPDILFTTAQDIHLSRISQYLFDLSKKFSSFYQTVPILQESDENKRISRLTLIQATAQVLENGLKLLGIRTLEEM